MTTLFGFGFGTGTTNAKGEILEVLFPDPICDHAGLAESAKILSALQQAGIAYNGGNQSIELQDEQLGQLHEALVAAELNDYSTAVSQSIGGSGKKVLVVMADDGEPQSVAEAYFKLHLLSHRQAKPHSVNLQGIFACLPNVAWTSDGPIELSELPQRQLAARNEGRWLAVKSVDKFPPMTDYVVPSGVRIAHTARVRLGAYIGEGTTIMHEGFVNFNAGTEGTSMIEGRISAGVFVGEGSDLGGGCSTMGTLSGGGNVVISVGKECLIGANAGIGIALGDRCTVEAGLYVTAGSKIALLDEKGDLVKYVKARELNGQSDLLFRRNSTTGAMECKTNQSVIELNAALHSHN